VALSGNRLATAEGSGGVRLFDVEHPRTPARLRNPRDAGGARDVAFAGELLLVAAGRRGLLVYRLDPERGPTRVGEIPTERAARGVVALDDATALVSCGSAGLLLVDLGDPDAPRVRSTLQLPRGYPAGRVALDGSLAFVACDVAGFAVVEFADPTNPVVLLPRLRGMRVLFP
jgi:hypothetical protein